MQTRSDMSDDLLDNVLNPEEEFYNEGHAAGLADGAQAGLVEGRLFGIEKGYEKALELGRLHGRALFWHHRVVTAVVEPGTGDAGRTGVYSRLPTTSQNKSSRLIKNIESLLVLTTSDGIALDNSEDSVGDLDERLGRARTKAKLIANVMGESVEDGYGDKVDANGIEDSNGLKARQ